MKNIYALAVGALLCLAEVAQAAPAIRIDDFGCNLLDGNKNPVSTDRSHAVVTSSGTSMLKCQVENVPNDTGRAVQWDYANTNLLCSTYGGLTEDWKITVSASGQATLTCKVRP